MWCSTCSKVRETYTDNGKICCKFCQRILNDCQHEHIHREGSLGWFCNKCGSPVEDSEEYRYG